jgi:hypothetical protein
MADYVRINWQNGDSGQTPIDASNLNIMDKGIKDLDDKVNSISVTVTDDGDGNVTMTIGGTTT